MLTYWITAWTPALNWPSCALTCGTTKLDKNSGFCWKLHFSSKQSTPGKIKSYYVWHRRNTRVPIGRQAFLCAKTGSKMIKNRDFNAIFTPQTGTRTLSVCKHKSKCLHEEYTAKKSAIPTPLCQAGLKKTHPLEQQKQELCKLLLAKNCLEGPTVENIISDVDWK